MDSTLPPGSPSCQPLRLGFDGLQTPQPTRSARKRMKENLPPQTPLSTSKDHEYSAWLKHNGFGKILLNPTVNCAIVKVLRRYANEISGKVEQLLHQHNELQQWKTDIGQPALDTIERHKLIEKEFKTERESMNDEYTRKKQECVHLQSQLKDLQQRLQDIYAPKLKEHDNMIQQINSMQKEHTSLQQEYKSLKQQYSTQTKAMEKVTKMNEKLNQEISSQKEYKSKAETEIAQLQSKLAEVTETSVELETQNEEMRANFEILQEKQVNGDPFASSNKNRHHRGGGKSSDYGQCKSLEDEFNAGFNEKNPERIPNEFVWNYTEDDDEEDQRVQDQPKSVQIESIDNLVKKMEEIHSSQHEQFQSVSEKLSQIQNETKRTISDSKDATKTTLHQMMTSLQTMLRKVHSEQNTMQRTLCSFKENMAKSIINESGYSRSSSYGNIEIDPNSTNSAKIDALTHYLKAMKLDQRIITVYKKIETKIESMKSNNDHQITVKPLTRSLPMMEEKQIKQIMERQSKCSQDLNQIQMDLQAIAYKQEAQKEGIDHSLEVFRDLFEQQLAQILNQIHVSEKKETAPCSTRSISPPIFANCNASAIESVSKKKKDTIPIPDSKALQLSPIMKSKTSKYNDSFNADSFLNAINGIESKKHSKATRSTNNKGNAIQREQQQCYGGMVEAQSARVHELMMSEFVMVLTNNLDVATEHSFNKLFVMIIQITHCLHLVIWDGLKSMVTANPINVSGRLESILMSFKAEIDGVFRTIFQELINNAVKDLIEDKMQRIKLQSRISKLTNKLNHNKQHTMTLSKTQEKKLKQQINEMSIQNLYVPLIAAILVVFLLGIICGYCLISSSSSNDFSNQFI